jgi:hypothetical protein
VKFTFANVHGEKKRKILPLPGMEPQPSSSKSVAMLTDLSQFFIRENLKTLVIALEFVLTFHVTNAWGAEDSSICKFAGVQVVTTVLVREVLPSGSETAPLSKQYSISFFRVKE